MALVLAMHFVSSSRNIEEGYVYVVDADLKSYFDTIPQRSLTGFGQEAYFGLADIEAAQVIS